MNFARVIWVTGLLAACSTGHYATVDPGHAAFVVPHHIAEGKGEGADLPAHPAPTPDPEQSSSGSAPASPPPSTGSTPDPEPLSSVEQWEYQLLFQNGVASVESVTHRKLPKPVPTPRRMGRFALELWIGHELIDRVRFDFPLLAAEERPGIKRRPLHDAPSLAAHAIARVRVSLPASPRATRLVLVDRATDKTEELPWPPEAAQGSPAPAPAGSGGAAP